MNQREIDILQIEESFKDVVENEIKKENTENKKVEIKDIKYIGNASWKDKINGKTLSDRVFILEKEITETDKNGKELKKEMLNYYLGGKCIGGKIAEMEPTFSTAFEKSESDKMEAVKNLLKSVNEKDLYSMKNLENKQLAEVLSAYFGKKINPENVEEELNKMDEEEIEKMKNDGKERENGECKLTKKQTEKVKINGIQEVNLNKLVDGKETLGRRLDLEEYDKICVIYSDKINNIENDANKHINNTTYSLVGIEKDGTAKKLDNEFKIDTTVGNYASREQTKIRANSTATRDNRDISVYTRKSNGASIGCENDIGNVNMFLYQKTLEENENIGIQIETSKTPVIPIETREIMNRNKGIYQKDNVQDEIKEHTEEKCEPHNVKDFDGYANTETHIHYDEIYINNSVQDILNYENNDGEEAIKEVFTSKEVKDKLLRELEENKNKISIEQIIENVKNEMDADAQMYQREHKR